MMHRRTIHEETRNLEVEAPGGVLTVSKTLVTQNQISPLLQLMKRLLIAQQEKKQDMKRIVDLELQLSMNTRLKHNAPKSFFFSILFSLVWFILMIPVWFVRCTLTIGMAVGIAHLLCLCFADNRDAIGMGAFINIKFNIN